jgi:hypothetical protein
MVNGELSLEKPRQIPSFAVSADRRIGHAGFRRIAFVIGGINA